MENIVILVKVEDIWYVDSDYAYCIEGFYRHYRVLKDDVLSPEEVKSIGEHLLTFKATPEELEQHKKELQKIFGNN